MALEKKDLTRIEELMHKIEAERIAAYNEFSQVRMDEPFGEPASGRGKIAARRAKRVQGLAQDLVAACQKVIDHYQS